MLCGQALSPSNRLIMALTPPHPPQPTVAQLQFELSEAAKLYTAATTQLTQLKHAYNTLITQHTHQQQLTQQQQQHNQQLQSDYQQHYTAYAATLQQKEDELAQLLASHVPLEALDVLRVKVREEAREAMRDKVATVVDELTAVRAQLAAVEKEKAVQAVQHEHTTNLLQTQLAQLKAEHDSRADDWKRRTAQWQDKEDERRTERQRWEAVERENVEWSVRWKRATEEADERRKEDERRDDIHRRERLEWEREKGELTSQRAVLTQQLSNARRHSEECDKERERYKREANEWQTKADNLEEEAREQREEARRREAEVAGLREVYERRVREREQAEEERGRQHRLAVDELYGQVKAERELKEALRRVLLEKQEELVTLTKRQTELQAKAASNPTSPSSSSTTHHTNQHTASVTATIAQLQADLTTARNQLATAHSRTRTLEEQHGRLLLRYEQAHTQWQQQQREAVSQHDELASLQQRYRSHIAEQTSAHSRLEELSVALAIVEKERDELRRERDEERRWVAEGREVQMRGWRQEKAVLLQRLADGEGGGSGKTGGGEGKYKAMCGVMRERLEGMVREYQKERGEWQHKLQAQQLAMEEMQRRVAETDKFQQQLHRSMQSPTKLTH